MSPRAQTLEWGTVVLEFVTRQVRAAPTCTSLALLRDLMLQQTARMNASAAQMHATGLRVPTMNIMIFPWGVAHRAPMVRCHRIEEHRSMQEAVMSQATAKPIITHRLMGTVYRAQCSIAFQGLGIYTRRHFPVISTFRSELADAGFSDAPARLCALTGRNSHTLPSPRRLQRQFTKAQGGHRVASCPTASSHVLSFAVVDHWSCLPLSMHARVDQDAPF